MSVSLYRAARRVLNRYSVTLLSRPPCQRNQPALPYSTQQLSTHQFQTNKKNSSLTQDFSEFDLIKEKLRSNDINGVEAVNILSMLKTFVLEKGIGKLESDSGFVNLCSVIGKVCPQYTNYALINCVKMVLDYKMSPESYIVKSLETEILWRLRVLNPRQLAIVLSFHLEHQNDDLFVNVLKETIQTIQRRWVEVDNVRDVGQLLLLRDNFNKDLVLKLEDRAIDTMEKTSADDMVKFLVLLAKIKQRSPPVLRSIAFHLSKHTTILNAKQIANVFCAMNTLTFPDELLLERLSNDLVSQIKNVENSTIIAAILTSIGQLKWKHTELLNALSDWILANKDTCRTKDLVAFTLTTAGLNYSPLNDDIVKLLLEQLTEDNVASAGIWLDVVRSLVIHRKAKENHLTSVLKPGFLEKLTGVSSKTKLLQINTAAKSEFPNYKGPFLTNEAMVDFKIQENKQREQQKLFVCDALTNFLPRGTFMNTRQVIDNSIIVDAEFFVDEKAKPLPLEKYVQFFDSNSLRKSLPSGVNKMCVMVLDFKHFTLNSQELTGATAFSKRLLEKMNYKVVEIPYVEFSRLDTTLKKVQYLQKKITDCLSLYEDKSIEK